MGWIYKKDGLPVSFAYPVSCIFVRYRHELRTAWLLAAEDEGVLQDWTRLPLNIADWTPEDFAAVFIVRVRRAGTRVLALQLPAVQEGDEILSAQCGARLPGQKRLEASPELVRLFVGAPPTPPKVPKTYEQPKRKRRPPKAHTPEADQDGRAYRRRDGPSFRPEPETGAE